MGQCLINMNDSNDWESITMCVTDDNNLTQMYKMNQQNMMGLFAQLVTAHDYASRKGKNPAKLTFNNQTTTYDYATLMTIFNAIHEWMDQFIDEGPAVEFFEDDETLANLEDIETNSGC